MEKHRNPFRNAAVFIIAATLLVVVLAVATYFLIGVMFR